MQKRETPDMQVSEERFDQQVLSQLPETILYACPGRVADTRALSSHQPGLSARCSASDCWSSPSPMPLSKFSTGPEAALAAASAGAGVTDRRRAAGAHRDDGVHAVVGATVSTSMLASISEQALAMALARSLALSSV